MSTYNSPKLNRFVVYLSEVVSKYVGNTKKNLIAIFGKECDDARVFEETDPLFGRRSNVKESRDN